MDPSDPLHTLGAFRHSLYGLQSLEELDVEAVRNLQSAAGKMLETAREEAVAEEVASEIARSG